MHTPKSGGDEMDRTVRGHIQSLEEKRNSLSALLIFESGITKRNQLETELRAVESALTLYRSALEIESRLSQKPART